MNINELADYLPHRPPAIWIDEVTEEASYVVLKKSAPYYSNGVLRPSSLIEFIAQSFGYQSALKILDSGVKPTAASKAFLVAVTKCTLKDTATLKVGERLKITIGDTKVIGPITVISATVTDSNGTEYANASLKVFAE